MCGFIEVAEFLVYYAASASVISLLSYRAHSFCSHRTLRSCDGPDREIKSRYAQSCYIHSKISSVWHELSSTQASCAHQ